MSIPVPFKPDQKITDVFKEGRFTLSAEILPPRNGSSQRGVLEQVQRLISSGAEFLSVTKGAGGSLRGGSLPIAQVIKETFGVPCIAHFTCRDLTQAEVENHLVDHHFLEFETSWHSAEILQMVSLTGFLEKTATHMHIS